jgi:hypothetical protein
MLPIDFANSQNDSPTLASTLAQLEGWVKGHPKAKFIDPRRVLSEVEMLTPAALTVALSLLVRKGLLVRKFRVVAPTTQTLADAEFKSIDEIPAELFDTSDNRFRTDDAEVVPIFRGVSD